MPKSIIDLLRIEFEKVADRHEQHVLSEEAVRFLIHLLNREEGLNLVMVNKANLPNHLDRLVGLFQSQTPSTPIRHQIVLKTTRPVGNITVSPDSAYVHYLALDLLFLPDGRKFSFLVDHYNGSKVVLEELAAAENKHSIRRLQAGRIDDKKMNLQADEVHCPIFTLNHLAETARIEQLFDFLATKANAQGVIKWDDLPPQLIWNAQSLSFLYEYAEKTAKEQAEDDAEDSLVSPLGRYSLSFSDHVNNNLHMAMVIKEGKAAIRMANYAIKSLAACYAANAILSLELGYYSERELLDIAYQEAYPNIYEVLQSILRIQEGQSSSSSSFSTGAQAHPLLSLVFNYSEQLEKCLHDKSFHKVFSDPTLLEMLKDKDINGEELLKYISPNFKVNKELARIIEGNLPALKAIAILSKGRHLANQKSTPLGLLKLPRTKSLFTLPLEIAREYQQSFTQEIEDDLVESAVAHAASQAKSSSHPTSAASSPASLTSANRSSSNAVSRVRASSTMESYKGNGLFSSPTSDLRRTSLNSSPSSKGKGKGTRPTTPASDILDSIHSGAITVDEVLTIDLSKIMNNSALSALPSPLLKASYLKSLLPVSSALTSITSDNREREGNEVGEDLYHLPNMSPQPRSPNLFTPVPVHGGTPVRINSPEVSPAADGTGNELTQLADGLKLERASSAFHRLKAINQ